MSTDRSYNEWLNRRMNILWAFVKANLFWLRSPLKYQVWSISEVVLFDGAAAHEEISFVGIIEDVITGDEFAIIHKPKVIKTFYGEFTYGD